MYALKKAYYFSAIVFVGIVLPQSLLSQPETPPAEEKEEAFAIVLGSEVAFSLRAARAGFSAEERARIVQRRVDRLLRLPEHPRLSIAAEEGVAELYADDALLVSLVPEDLAPGKQDLRAFAEDARGRLDTLLVETRSVPVEPDVAVEGWLSQLRGFFTMDLLKGVGLALGLIGLILALLWLISRIFAIAGGWLSRRQLPDLKARGRMLLSSEALRGVLETALRLIYLVVLVFVAYSALRWSITYFALDPNSAALIYVRGSLNVALTFAVAALAWRTSERLFAYLLKSVSVLAPRIMAPVQLQQMTVVTPEQVATMLTAVLRLLRLVLRAVLTYVTITLALSYFPLTRGWSVLLADYILTPLSSGLSAILDYLPNLFFIALIIVAAVFFLRVVRFFFRGIELNRMTIPGFHADWATPTYRVVAFFSSAFALVLIFPYLPGSGSDAFKGVSIFIGFLFSLGSSGVIGNIVAGLVVTYMRPFRIGDRVRISDTEGDIVEKNLLVTRLRTTKNVEITIPNGMVLASHIINYSTAAQESGLVLHTSVTIGYDVPWQQVRDLLVAAAKKTEGVLASPAPFVVQKGLEDFYVHYELNGYTHDPNRMAMIYSELHAHILDEFHAAGVEILSPHYRAERDGTAIAMPPQKPTD